MSGDGNQSGNMGGMGANGMANAMANAMGGGMGGGIGGMGSMSQMCPVIMTPMGPMAAVNLGGCMGSSMAGGMGGCMGGVGMGGCMGGGMCGGIAGMGFGMGSMGGAMGSNMGNTMGGVGGTGMMGGMMGGGGSMGMKAVPNEPKMLSNAGSKTGNSQSSMSTGISSTGGKLQSTSTELAVPDRKWNTLQEEDPEAMTKQVYAGTVANFDYDRNSGFIVCEEIRAKCNQDVYYFRKVIEPCGAGVGDIVCFTLHVSPKGLPQAELPVLRLSTPGDFANVGIYVPPKSSQSLGHGSIENKDFSLIFGRNPMVPPAMVQGFRSGQRLAFNCMVALDGLPYVQEAVIVDKEWNPQRKELFCSSSLPDYTGPNRRRNPQESSNTSSGMMEPRPPLSGPGSKEDPANYPKDDQTDYYGTIKLVAENGNYAFIKCAESRNVYGRDIFLHEKTVGVDNLRIGQRVKFKVTLNPQGKPFAEPCDCVETPDLSAGKELGEDGEKMVSVAVFNQGMGRVSAIPMGGCMGNMGTMGSMGGMGMVMGMGGTGNLSGNGSPGPPGVPSVGGGGNDPWSTMGISCAPPGAEFGMTPPDVDEAGSAAKRLRVDVAR